MGRRDSKLPPVSDLEAEVMDILWREGSGTAEEVRRELRSHQLTDSTVRTLLRRLEGKGYLEHRTESRRFVYRPAIERGAAAAAAVSRVVRKVCGGTVDSLLVGMVQGGVVRRQEIERLEELLERIEEEDDA